MAKPKEVVLEALQALPDDASYDDIEYHLFVRARIEEARRAAAEGRVAPHAEVKKQIAAWRKRAR